MARMTDLRRQANEAAQEALRDVVSFYVKHPGRRNVLLEDTYRAAERVLDAIDEFETAANAASQATDPEAPDYFLLFTESEMRLMDGNR